MTLEVLVDPVFWVVSIPLVLMMAACLRRIADPFWADPSRRKPSNPGTTTGEA